MSAADFLGRLVAILDAAAVPYMVAGSFASTFHGIPRLTQDIDVVVRLDSSAVSRLLAALPPDEYYVSEEAARDAVRRRSQFNVIDLATGWKADLIVQKARPFSELEMQRRLRVTLLGTTLFVASAEDTIIAKLEWARESRSARQLGDVRDILSVRGASLDRPYIEAWAAALGVSDLWRDASAGEDHQG